MNPRIGRVDSTGTRAISRIGQQTSPAPTRHVELHRRDQPSPSSSRSRKPGIPVVRRDKLVQMT
ncbi:hypothetical protein AB0D12_10310 [Streptomyces sp. NPDC048479]|uniref:hypothetical protein n=1 Tax=Streptomyces sp. NPDC048479 TaxID=3154725 RepID=UPI00342A325F